MRNDSKQAAMYWLGNMDLLFPQIIEKPILLQFAQFWAQSS